MNRTGLSDGEEEPEICEKEKRIPIGEASYRPAREVYNVRWFREQAKKYPTAFPTPILAEIEIVTAETFEAFDIEYEPYKGSESGRNGRLIKNITKKFCKECNQEPFYDQHEEEYYCPNCQ